MLAAIQNTLNDLSHFLFPHICLGCKTDQIAQSEVLCVACSSQLPKTGFIGIQHNATEQVFLPRIPIEAAGSLLYFNTKSTTQELLHHLKYKQYKEVGSYLGNLMGMEINDSKRFNEVDAIVPIPIHPKKLYIRGYNQAEVIADGIAKFLQLPTINNWLVKTVAIASQTKKNRVDRWQSVDQTYSLNAGFQQNFRHILLVDDVLTTGATLETCARLFIEKGIKVSIATAAITI